MIRVVHPGSRIRMLTFYPSRIPNPGVKKAADPGSGSATLILLYHFFLVFPLKIITDLMLSLNNAYSEIGTIHVILQLVSG